MFCNKCGTQLPDSANVCSNCGQNTGNNQAPVSYRPADVDTGGFLWGLLGFCVPVVGLVLYLVWKAEKPITARAAGMGALIYAIIAGIFAVLYFIVIMVAVAVV